MRTPSGSPGGWRRTSLLSAVIGACLLAAVACSSKSSKSPSSASSQPTAVSASASVSAAPSSGGAATLQISQAWARFFAGTTSASDKQALLENGSAFAAAIAAQANSPIAKSTMAIVSKVTMVSADQAQVTYTISIGGLPALTNQTGTAVLVNGSWKVGAASFCQLLSLEGQTPSACPATSAPASS